MFLANRVARVVPPPILRGGIIKAQGLLRVQADAVMKTAPFAFAHHPRNPEESFWGHALAIVTGAFLIAIGVALAATVALVGAGSVVGLAGLLLLGGGLFARIEKPLTIKDLADSVVTLVGAAIAMTFAAVAAIFLCALALSLIVGVTRWVAHLLG